MEVKPEMANITVSWVKMHQDNKLDIELLTLEGKLDVKADVDVNQFRADTLPRLVPSSTPTVLFLTNDGSVITGGLQQWLQELYISTNIADYIRPKT
eukprot:5168348-Ditylum_brightwellii.AAC.1